MASDPISRDALLERIQSFRDMLRPDLFVSDRVQNDTLGIVSAVIINLPAIDTVEVVRCKDCVHAGAFPNDYSARRFEGRLNCFLCRGDDGYGIANVSVVYPDDYCSDGVRREKQDEDHS